MIQRIHVQVRTPCHPTEKTDRVVEAITTIFPSAEIEITASTIEATTHSLDTFSELLHQREILDTARAEFVANQRSDGFSFRLKKQPASNGVVTFVVGNASELGEISVDVTVEEPSVQEVIDHIAPPTKDGVPIRPEDR